MLNACAPWNTVLMSCAGARSLGAYTHVGSPIWLDRNGEFLPGNYTAFARQRPNWYTGSTYDHHGYLLAIKQALLCNPAF